MPDSSSRQYEVHVLSVYEVINRRPPKAGDAIVNIISRGKSDRPIILVLGSYEPVNWILNLPANVTISKVILVSKHPDHFGYKLRLDGSTQSLQCAFDNLFELYRYMSYLKQKSR